MVARALPVALGTATVAIAAIAARGRTAAIVTAFLFAASHMMVHYGSEARGYAGLVLFTLAAVAVLERTLDGRPRPLLFAAAVLLGFLSHLTFAATIAALVAWAALVLWRRTRSLSTINVEIGALFGPAFLAVLPLALCMLAGRAVHGFSIGGVTPFSLDRFLAGYGGAIRNTLGLPAAVPDMLAVAAVVVAVPAWAMLRGGRRGGLYVTGIVLLPLAMAAAHLPNVQYPRYFLVSMTLLLLWLGDVLAQAIGAGGWRRMLAAACCALFIAGNASAIAAFYAQGRGSYQPTVDRIAADADTSYGASHSLRVPIVVDLLARPHATKPHFIPLEELCAGQPRWFVLDATPEPPAALRPSSACDLAYGLVEFHPGSGVSGSDWALYRRAEQ